MNLTGLRLASGLALGGDLLVEAVQAFGLGAVKVEPPITNKVTLVENGSVGAQKGIFSESSLTIGGTDVESLAFGLGVGVVS